MNDGLIKKNADSICYGRFQEAFLSPITIEYTTVLPHFKQMPMDLVYVIVLGHPNAACGPRTQRNLLPTIFD